MVTYITTYNLSEVSGPSVNENSFIKYLKKYREDILCDSFYFNKENKKNSKLRKIFLQNVFLYKKISNPKQKTSLILRLDLFPFALFFLNKNNFNGVFLKTAGDGRYRVLGQKKFGRFFVNIQKFILKSNMHKFKGIDSVTKCQADRFNDVFNKLPFVVQNSVDILEFQPPKLSDSSKKIIIGYGGTNAETRGGVEVIKCVNILSNNGIDAGGVITGDYKNYGILRKMAKDLFLEDKIKFTGSVPPEEMKNIISSFSIGVSFLSKEQRCASEQKVRQYFSCGVPALLSSSDDNDLFQEKGLALVLNNEINLTTLKTLLSFNRDKIVKYTHQNLSLKAVNDKRLKNWNII
ncbi:glycosyltransferase [Flavobacteriaceae bacterium]|nr:glycosyltransferase [Flavobacteriaceae bacterium]